MAVALNRINERLPKNIFKNMYISFLRIIILLRGSEATFVGMAVALINPLKTGKDGYWLFKKTNSRIIIPMIQLPAVYFTRSQKLRWQLIADLSSFRISPRANGKPARYYNK
jgi:hypothetical protein